MKHLYIVNEFSSSLQNGIGVYIHQLIRILKGLDISIGIIDLNSNLKSFSMSNVGGVAHYYFPKLSDKNIMRQYLVINKLLRLYIEDNHDNIFLFNYFPCFDLMNLIYQSHPDSKQYCVIHDMAWTIYLSGDIELYHWVLEHINDPLCISKYFQVIEAFKEEMRTFNHADKIITLSKDTYQLLTDYYKQSPQKLYLIPNILPDVLKVKNVDIIRREKLIDSDEIILLYVGRVTELKGIFSYIEAFKDVVKRYKQCRLVIIGNTYKWGEVLSKCSSISSKIIFTGPLLPKDIDKWYQIADIAVFPSLSEQCSFVGLEIIAHRLLVIASDAFGVRCMFTNENAIIAHINGTLPYQEELFNATLNAIQIVLKGKKKTIFNRNIINSYSAMRVRQLYKEAMIDC